MGLGAGEDGMGLGAGEDGVGLGVGEELVGVRMGWNRVQVRGWGGAEWVQVRMGVWLGAGEGGAGCR